jgi:SAM-dependent methyltransferase
LGRRYFGGLRRAFEELARRFAIGFRSAADLGCGTGLFACYLARRFRIPVIAVDRSREMLAIAQRNCQDCRIGYLLQDIRHLRLPGPVDLITATFDTLNHLLSERDLRRVLMRVQQNLRPGGHFVFDLLTDRQRLQRPVVVVAPAASLAHVKQSFRWDPDTRLLSTRVAIHETGSVAVRHELHVERGYDPVRVARWLQCAGFELRALLDAPTLSQAQTDSSRVIFVARKEPRTGKV